MINCQSIKRPLRSSVFLHFSSLKGVDFHKRNIRWPIGRGWLAKGPLPNPRAWPNTANLAIYKDELRPEQKTNSVATWPNRLHYARLYSRNGLGTWPNRLTRPTT
jgi:hypothetical protein